MKLSKQITQGNWRQLETLEGFCVVDENNRDIINRNTKESMINTFMVAKVPQMIKALERIAEWDFDIMGDCVKDAKDLANRVLYKD